MGLDPLTIALGLAGLLAVVAVGARALHRRVMRGVVTEEVAFDASTAPEREDWARSLGWQYIPGPAPVPPNGLEPAGFLAPVTATQGLRGVRSGRPVLVSVRSGELLEAATRTRRDWRAQAVEIGVKHPVPPLVLISDGEFHVGVLPGAYDGRPELGVIRRPLGRPWLLAAPLGREGAVTTALAGVLGDRIPGGVVVTCDGMRVVVQAPGSGARRDVEQWIVLAERVATALEDLPA